ncbi:MAG: UDP-N-acetylmuramoyl-L-alanine--D-glutamate ligase [Patescibacteria group bacterium]
MKIAILGFGKEGKSALKFLRAAPRYKGAEIVILDQKQGGEYLAHLKDFDLVIKSPGVPFVLPEIAHARKSGTLFTSATALFFDHADGLIIGITGTKGKGTTAVLLYRMLKAAKKDAYLAGNIGRPMLDILPKLKTNSIAVLELSSFQLERLMFSPRVAVVLDVFPDHLDAHASYEEYVAAKKGIVEHQGKHDAVFFFPGNKDAEAIAQHSKGKKIQISPEDFTLFSPEDLKIPGTHNYKNAVMAASVALYMGCPAAVVRKAALLFQGLPFRLQRIRSAGGILFYNDSAATNPHAAAAAIASFTMPTILIMGGRDKGFSYDILPKTLMESSVRHIIAIGENASLIEQACGMTGIKVTAMQTLNQAVQAAWRYALKQQKKNEEWNILFSPGAASFDMFRDYKERGREFNKIVKGLKI